MSALSRISRANSSNLRWENIENVDGNDGKEATHSRMNAAFRDNLAIEVGQSVNQNEVLQQCGPSYRASNQAMGHVTYGGTI